VGEPLVDGSPGTCDVTIHKMDYQVWYGAHDACLSKAVHPNERPLGKDTFEEDADAD
jgi:hypothetical protein